MSSEKVVMGFVLLFILIFTYPSFNDGITAIGEDVNATDMEVTLMGITPPILVVFISCYAGVLIYYTVEEIR